MSVSSCENDAMKQLMIDIDEVQKAMEDIEREAFEYFLDRETGDVIILSSDILKRAERIIAEAYEDDLAEYEEVVLDEVPEVPEWMEEEIELAVDIMLFSCERYVRIPERDPKAGFNAMKAFVAAMTDEQLREELIAIVDGRGAFRRFKDRLETLPKERKLWYGFNAKAAKREIESWLSSVGITSWKAVKSAERA